MPSSIRGHLGATFIRVCMEMVEENIGEWCRKGNRLEGSETSRGIIHVHLASDGGEDIDNTHTAPLHPVQYS